MWCAQDYVTVLCPLNRGLVRLDGGWGGIRTHGRLAPTPVFKTGALNHSATHPSKEFRRLADRRAR